MLFAPADAVYFTDPVSRVPWRQVARYAPIAIIGGGVFGLAINRFHWDLQGFLHGGLIGFTCFAFAVSAESLLHTWFEARPEAWWRRALTYFFASQAGWPVGLFLGLPLIHGRPISDMHFPRAAWGVLIVTSVLGPLLGLVVYGYERLKERLKHSIEQLKEKEFAEKELELARELQSRMLPAPEIAGERYSISSRNLAARFVAGDFYDVFPYGNDAIGIAVADVAGKGMPASLLMASVKAVLPLLASNRTVDEAMIALNEKLVGELTKREFVALALARYEPLTGRVAFVNAGLPDPYHLRGSSATPVEASGPRMPLGLRRGIRYEAQESQLEPGEAMLFLSDGLPEAPLSDGEQLGYERLGELVAAAGDDVDELLRRLDAATQTVPDDDQTVVMLRRLAAPGVISRTRNA